MITEEKSLEEQKAEVLIKLRKYELISKEKYDEEIVYIVKTPSDGKKALMYCVPDETTVGIAYINRMVKAMADMDVEKGIMITRGRYTHTAKKKAVGRKIELLPRIFPAFDIFTHNLVPKHEILTHEERKKMLSHYRIRPYQLPQIKAIDPAVKAIGAKRGDILKILRNSSTAGRSVAYRYVV